MRPPRRSARSRERAKPKPDDQIDDAAADGRTARSGRSCCRDASASTGAQPRIKLRQHEQQWHQSRQQQRQRAMPMTDADVCFAPTSACEGMRTAVPGSRAASQSTVSAPQARRCGNTAGSIQPAEQRDGEADDADPPCPRCSPLAAHGSALARSAPRCVLGKLQSADIGGDRPSVGWRDAAAKEYMAP